MTRSRADTDVLILKFDPTGSTLDFATYIGGEGNDRARCAGSPIVLDSQGRVVVASSTASARFSGHRRELFPPLTVEEPLTAFYSFFPLTEPGSTTRHSSEGPTWIATSAWTSQTTKILW